MEWSDGSRWNMPIVRGRCVMEEEDRAAFSKHHLASIPELGIHVHLLEIDPDSVQAAHQLLITLDAKELGEGKYEVTPLAKKFRPVKVTFHLTIKEHPSGKWTPKMPSWLTVMNKVSDIVTVSWDTSSRWRRAIHPDMHDLPTCSLARVAL